MICLQKNENNYPILLKNIKNAPQELYIAGNINCIELPCVTVIGSRNMSEYGRKMTEKIVKELTLAGMCIVSGLAIGVDSVAHRTCLQNGGKTIAVLGSGLNKVYPKENIGLFNDIINCGGCVISEQEPNQEANKIFFPARNRIVSGLSLGTVVIEATYRSGTSITAKFALEQGRKLFCLPNMIGQKNSAGTINLIKNGAIMVTKASEIIDQLCKTIDDENNNDKVLENCDLISASIGKESIDMLKKTDNYERLIKYWKSKTELANKVGKKSKNIENIDLDEHQEIVKMNLMEQEILNGLDSITKKIYLYIKDNKVVNSEIMSDELNINIQDLNSNLTILELNGLITNRSGSNYGLKENFDV